MASHKRPRASYTLQFKMSVVEWLESNGASLRAAARKFSVDRKLIRNWVSDKERMKQELLARGPGTRKLHIGRSPVSEELDKLVLEHYLTVKSSGSELSGKEIRAQALEYARLLGLQQFKATPSWVSRWRGRCGLEQRHETFGMELENETVATLLHIASTLLSQVRPSDSVNLTKGRTDQSVNRHQSHDQTEASCDQLYFDYSTPEHNYCKPPNSAVNCHMTPHELSCDPQTVITDTLEYDLINDSVISEPVLECEVAEIDLPLGKEVEIVHDLAAAKVKGGSDLNARSTSPPFFSPLTFDLDDPQSRGGLLASRMLQPVFPDEPEIVYLDMQLGMLHSIH